MLTGLKKMKDMNKARISRNRQRKRYYQKTNFSLKRRKFRDYDVWIILNSKFSDVEIAKTLKRSVLSIQIKRCRLLKKG